MKILFLKKRHGNDIWSNINETAKIIEKINY